ncbi:MAG: type II secretion system F family protein [Opitutae bacterium]|nr:type II secretion system F family protein [Opitutae bacterium]
MPVASTRSPNPSTSRGKGKPGRKNPRRKPRSRRTGILNTRVRRKALTLFTGQLATLLRSGLPLLKSLEVLTRQQRNPGFRRIIRNLADDVRAGNTISNGLARYPKVFGNLYCNMVRAGEASGHLDLVLDRLARFMEKAQRLRGKLMAAMVYPIVVMTLAFSILGFLMVFVVPRFEAIYANFLGGASLPPLTQAILNLSLFVKDRILIILIVVFLLIAGIKLLGTVEKVRYAVDLMKVKLPIFGDLLKKSALSRFARTLGTLQGSAVPLLEALEITGAVVGNRVYQRELEITHARVRDGDPISKPLSQTHHFPEMVSSLIEVGEETGTVPDMLNRIADNYDQELDNSIAAMTSIMEPVMIVLLAVVVGVIVIALFLPLVGIFQNLAA